MTNKHVGSDFDEFLREEGILDDAEAVATKRMIAFQIAWEMKRADISQSEFAGRIDTSRARPDQSVGYTSDT